MLALLISADFHLLRREGQVSLGRADECLQVAIENDFEYMSRMASAHRARALIELDRAKESTIQLKRDIAALRTAGSEFQLPSFLTALGKGYGNVGQVTDGLTAVAEGLALSEKTGERWFDPELYRLKGELLLSKQHRSEPNVEDQAETCFRRSLEIAHQQRAKWWELRTTTSLVRLLASQGHRDDARAMLAEIYGWFTEGFDTAELKDAKALLDQLNAFRG